MIVSVHWDLQRRNQCNDAKWHFLLQFVPLAAVWQVGRLAETASARHLSLRLGAVLDHRFVPDLLPESKDFGRMIAVLSMPDSLNVSESV